MVILHNNTESAYDRTAKKMIHQFFEKLTKRDANAFLKYLKDHGQTAQDFDTVIFLDPYYKPVFRETVEEAYTDALNADCECPNFIRWWRTGETTNIVAAVECSLFAGRNPADYRDENGWLTQKIKDLAIAEIKANLYTDPA